MIHNYNMEKIYFSKTRAYFKEVTTSFSIGNYRSANVMLYSIAISDILFKLKDLADTYDDKTAKSILKTLEGKEGLMKKNSGAWEEELIDKVQKETRLLNNYAFANLKNLKTIRNLSAHPALDENYELINPTREETISNITNIYNNILIKSPIFLSDIITRIISDVTEKKDVYVNEREQLSNYLNRNYLSRMTDKMIIKLFKTFWKFCFKLPDDQDCVENSLINLRVLEVIYNLKPDLIKKSIEETKDYYKISPSSLTMRNIVYISSIFPEIYINLDESTQHEIKLFPHKEYVHDIKLLSWFTSDNKCKHLESLKKEHNKYSYTEAAVKHTVEIYENSGLKDCVFEYLINYFLESENFNSADKRFENSIKLILDKLDKQEFTRLIEGIDSNDQIHKRNRSTSDNNLIVRKAFTKLGPEFDYEKYKNFRFDDNLLTVLSLPF